MRLSEADGGKLRIGDLASSTALSLSRISRMVNSLQRAAGWAKGGTTTTPGGG
ncbi:hypothetical protein ABZ461_30525 [Actinacidiphila glaucinigra]|uniref:hypothetical protein n=1 Tax=Actinacidiphila glaucinigra TaxID=235986 RepID=UPI0033DDADFB